MLCAEFVGFIDTIDRCIRLSVKRANHPSRGAERCHRV